MSRIRSTHPGLFTDEKFMELTVECPLAAILLQGIWCEADDHGVFEWKPLTIKAKVLPAVPSPIGELLTALEDLGFITRYSVEGREYGAVRNFTKWQRPKKPRVIHPKAEHIASYVGLGDEPVPHQFPTSGENPPQREDGGGRRDEEEEDIEPKAQQPTAARRFDDLQERLLVANGIAGFRAERSPGLCDLSPILALLDAGYDLELDILAAIRAKPNPGARNWRYFVPQIEDYAKLRRGLAKRAPVAPETVVATWSVDRWRLILADFERSGEWRRDLYGPKPGETGCRVPEELRTAA
jgi:hypothetical protein